MKEKILLSRNFVAPIFLCYKTIENHPFCAVQSQSQSFPALLRQLFCRKMHLALIAVLEILLEILCCKIFYIIFFSNKAAHHFPLSCEVRFLSRFLEVRKKWSTSRGHELRPYSAVQWYSLSSVSHGCLFLNFLVQLNWYLLFSVNDHYIRVSAWKSL